MTSIAPAPRLVVTELLRERADEVERLRAALRGARGFDEARHDELWLLRYTLSYPAGTAAAASAARRGLQWRIDNRMDDLSSTLSRLPIESWPGYAECRPFFAIQFYAVDSAALLVCVLNLSGCAFRELATRVPMGVILQFWRSLKEYSSLVVDEATRRTGVVYKVDNEYLYLQKYI